MAPAYDSHNITTDESPAGMAVRDLYRTIREDIEESDGSWNGGDVVEALCGWFTRHGFDVDGPNPYQDEEYDHSRAKEDARNEWLDGDKED
jgi:hypothetical protein